MNFTLRVWRQNGPKESGRFEEYPAHDIPSEASFLEMLDIVNEGLIEKSVEPITFDHDCREGICGTCSLTINGTAGADANRFRFVLPHLAERSGEEAHALKYGRRQLQGLARQRARV
jgi:hypothetical protein